MRRHRIFSIGWPKQILCRKNMFRQNIPVPKTFAPIDVGKNMHKKWVLQLSDFIDESRKKVDNQIKLLEKN